MNGYKVVLLAHWLSNEYLYSVPVQQILLKHVSPTKPSPSFSGVNEDALYRSFGSAKISWMFVPTFIMLTFSTSPVLEQCRPNRCNPVGISAANITSIIKKNIIWIGRGALFTKKSRSHLNISKMSERIGMPIFYLLVSSIFRYTTTTSIAMNIKTQRKLSKMIEVTLLNAQLVTAPNIHF